MPQPLTTHVTKTKAFAFLYCLTIYIQYCTWSEPSQADDGWWFPGTSPSVNQFYLLLNATTTKLRKEAEGKMQRKLELIIILLFQLLILFGLWLHSSSHNSHINQTVAEDRLTEPTQTPKGKTTEVLTKLSSCPETSPHLVGPLYVEFNWDRTMEAVRTVLGSTLLEGGRYKPPDCISHHKVSIVKIWYFN